jgi:bacteriocin-like protein
MNAFPKFDGAELNPIKELDATELAQVEGGFALGFDDRPTVGELVKKFLEAGGVHPDW